MFHKKANIFSVLFAFLHVYRFQFPCGGGAIGE